MTAVNQPDKKYVELWHEQSHHVTELRRVDRETFGFHFECVAKFCDRSRQLQSMLLKFLKPLALHRKLPLSGVKLIQFHFELISSAIFDNCVCEVFPIAL